MFGEEEKRDFSGVNEAEASVPLIKRFTASPCNLNKVWISL